MDCTSKEFKLSEYQKMPQSQKMSEKSEKKIINNQHKLKNLKIYKSTHTNKKQLQTAK